MSNKFEPACKYMCFRCHKIVEKEWSICDVCKDPVRNCDSEGQPHGYQLMKNGNQEWRCHGKSVRIVIASTGEEWIYKDGLLQWIYKDGLLQ